MPGYGQVWKDAFMKSESSVLRKLGYLMYIGPSMMKGLQQATEAKYVFT